MSVSSEHPALAAGLALLTKLERDGHLIKHPPGWPKRPPPGWQPPPVGVDDFMTFEEFDALY